MKKLLVLLLAALLLFSLVGCVSVSELEAARASSYESGKMEGYERGYEEGYGDACVEHGIESTETVYRGKVVGSPDEMVYISQTGSKYHSNQYCSNMNDPECVTKDAAINLGRTACKNCY